jgi:hypothetical protein
MLKSLTYCDKLDVAPARPCGSDQPHGADRAIPQKSSGHP